MRGEYEESVFVVVSSLGSPPHARGIPTDTPRYLATLGITPACAGNTCLTWHWLTWCRDHPRMRGEYADQAEKGKLEPGSPPHARGIRGNRGDRVRESGITPACAGNTYLSDPLVLASGDHPRMRGEYAFAILFPPKCQGSPPHARGIPAISNPSSSDPGITPACAGNTENQVHTWRFHWDHPRMRGEYVFMI